MERVKRKGRREEVSGSWERKAAGVKERERKEQGDREKTDLRRLDER
jgi:hypothetical protein